MGKEFRLKLEKVFDFLGEIIAFFVVAIWAVVILNKNFGFLNSVDQLRVVFEIVLEWALIVLLTVVGLECTIKRNILIRIIFYLLLAVVILGHCFEGAYNNIIQYIPGSNVTTTTGIAKLFLI